MATMKDVARLAGVSTSTVSHVINKDRFVSEAITAKVEAAIKELNYAPSALARSLKLNQTHTIGMLITASTNPFYSELVRGVERSCFERGGFAPIFPDICYHLTHYKPAAADIPV
ncbi:LacI family DNA-binding transcriptional regulator, partial [Escherichia coli]|uniref:LacI family DNA-binding transcriptional regulator n=1 Tax=Escherichia coli TaxID=562 RepID=UPI001FCECEF3